MKWRGFRSNGIGRMAGSRGWSFPDQTLSARGGYLPAHYHEGRAPIFTEAAGPSGPRPQTASGARLWVGRVIASTADEAIKAAAVEFKTDVKKLIAIPGYESVP
jgi:hypothetical protein